MAVDLADLERLRMVLLGSRAHTVAEAMIEIEALRNELAELRTHSAHLADELATATEMLENGAIAAREDRLVRYRCALLARKDLLPGTREDMAHETLAAERLAS